MNILEVDGYKAKIEYDPELEQFRGEILGLNGSADFYGNSLSALKKEFKNSLKIFLEVCKEKEISPLKEFSGKFNLRIPAKLHSGGRQPNAAAAGGQGHAEISGGDAGWG